MPDDSAVTAKQELPRHVAIIMDGNYRWAKQQGKPVLAGHRAGAENVRSLLRYYAKSGINILTLFAFSSENWLRPKSEVKNLWALFGRYLASELDKLKEENIRLCFIGNRNNLDAQLQDQMLEAERITAKDYRYTLVVALDYGGRWDIVNAIKSIVQEASADKRVLEAIDEAYVQRFLALGDLPDPDLCIRTGGEKRISNFLLWNFAYTEFYFSDVLWPDFNEEHLDRAMDFYAERKRRFGSRSTTSAMQG